MNTNSEQRKKVLIVDDEKDLREALFMTLAAEGYEVFSAPDGEAGLTLALTEKPDLILLDLQMPKLDGHGVLRALRADEWGKSVQVIVLTALGDFESISDTVEAGGMDYVVKSDVDLEDLAKMVKEKIK